ncbi:TBC1 domain family member 17-like isoform X3 [Grus americana]|uniref:TBC1 domain family member 17-like isoform X3 n=1 Tax=Grus americana TaxID=9117 RepID=UPI002407F45E|nr:TBC1 domain family member 17-like isoform X3 [Grus americana]
MMMMEQEEEAAGGRPEGTVLQWEPLEGPWDPPDDTEEPPDPGYEPDWAVLSPPRPRPQPPGWRGGFRLALGELRGLRRSPPGLRRPFLVLLPRRGPCPPPLHFSRGGPRKLLRLLAPQLRPCPRDPRLLLVTPQDDSGLDAPPQPPSPGLVTVSDPHGGAPKAPAPGSLRRHRGGAEPAAGGAPRPRPLRGGGGARAALRGHRLRDAGASPRPPAGATSDGGGVGAEPRCRGAELGPGRAEATPLPWGAEPPDPAPGLEVAAGAAAGGGPGPPGAELQWRSLSPDQERRNRPLRRYRHRLERDLARCHPDVPPLERALLHDVLLTFCMYHFDLGYVRGMSEVLAPLLTVTPNEVEAFWGFCSIMEMVGGNFGPGREGLKRQLGQLGQLVRVLDPNLCDRLEAGGTLGCCTRWLQLRFQPHFGLQGTLRLWEVLWTGLPCPNFHLVLSCVLLEMAGDVPPRPRDTGGDSDDGDGDSDDEDSDWDEAPPGRVLDAEEVLSRAEGLFLQLAAAPDLPPPLQELLGLGGPPPSPPPEPPHPENAGDPPPP